MASLSLLLHALPRHKEQSSSPMSFRQMGGSTGTISDIFESPLVKRMVEIGLSLNCDIERKEIVSPAKRHALTSILHVVSHIVMVGGASLISSTLGNQQNQIGLKATNISLETKC